MLMKWEYKVVFISSTDLSAVLERKFNELGEIGFELVKVTDQGHCSYNAIFKRPVED